MDQRRIHLRGRHTHAGNEFGSAVKGTGGMQKLAFKRMSTAATR